MSDNYPFFMAAAVQRKIIERSAQHFRDFLEMFNDKELDRQAELSWYVIHRGNKDLYEKIEVPPWYASWAVKAIAVDIALARCLFTEAFTMATDNAHAMRALARLIRLANEVGDPYFPPGTVPGEEPTFVMDAFALRLLEHQLGIESPHY